MSQEESSKPKSPKPSTGPAGARPGGYQGRPSSGPGRRPSGPGGPHGGPGARRGGRPAFRRRVCRVCQEKGGVVDWKAVNFLRVFISDRGKIIAGRSRGTCSPCQRQVARAINRARTMALLPFAQI